jgi:feruloyl esterase
MVVGSRRGVQKNFVPDPQKILDYSYRGNHVANQVSKTLIKAYYGQGPRYSYFIGCSDGGRQGLMEAQRFPEDFDAIGAGSPGILSTAQESTFHLWKVQANRRADGTNILMPGKVKLLHDAVVGQCDTLSGVKDGILQDPNACHFDPASLQCASAAMDTASCLTFEEVIAIQQLYDGAHDDKGNYFYWGLSRGSEGIWNLPETPTAEVASAPTHATQLAYILLPEVSPALADYREVTISKADFEQASMRSPMFDSANTDLKPFAARGGKLILWHGLNDVLIPAGATMAYYEGVQKFMGRQLTDKFLRAFYPPGVGHCGGGDGYTEIDVLSALMAWTEMKQPPTQIVAGKIAGGKGPGAGGPQARPDIIEKGDHAAAEKPYATPLPPLIATRPLYPYPYIARYTGRGDPNDASSYTRATSPATLSPPFKYAAVKLIGPDNQRYYQVKDGRLVVANER